MIVIDDLNRISSSLLKIIQIKVSFSVLVPIANGKAGFLFTLWRNHLLRMKHFLIYVLLLGLVSCQSKKGHEHPANADVEVYEFNMNEEHAIGLADQFSELEYIRISGDGKSHLYKIRAVEELGDHLAILSMDELWIADFDGKLRFRVGNSGQGPGEYAQLTNFGVDKDSGAIDILDGRSGKIIKYDASGKFLSEITHDAFYLAKDFVKVSEDVYAIYGGTFFSGTFDCRLLYFSVSAHAVVGNFFP